MFEDYRQEEERVYLREREICKEEYLHGNLNKPPAGMSDQAYINYEPSLLPNLVFQRIVGMPCGGFRFRFARVFCRCCQVFLCVVGSVRL